MNMSMTAQVATARPVAYVKQLCKQFGHKREVSFDDDGGVISFDDGVCELDAAGANTLVLTVRAEAQDGLTHVSDVIAAHLERFGRRDELTVRWDASGA